MSEIMTSEMLLQVLALSVGIWVIVLERKLKLSKVYKGRPIKAEPSLTTISY